MSSWREGHSRNEATKQKVKTAAVDLAREDAEWQRVCGMRLMDARGPGAKADMCLLSAEHVKQSSGTAERKFLKYRTVPPASWSLVPSEAPRSRVESLLLLVNL